MNSTINILDHSYNPYRFAFNSQEKTDEIAGAGNHNTALFWEYDTRTGRRWNRDPKPTVGISDYGCFANNPIFNEDILGDNIDDYKLNSKAGEISKIRTTDDKTDNLYAQGEDGNIDTKKVLLFKKAS